MNTRSSQRQGSGGAWEVGALRASGVLALVLSLASCAVSGPSTVESEAHVEACDPADRVEVDVLEWVEQLRAAAAREETRDALLARLDLQPPSTAANDLLEEGQEPSPFELTSIEVLRPRLLGEGAPAAFVVVASFTDGVASSVRARVLLPSGPHACHVPNGDLSYDVPHWQQPTLGEEEYGGGGRHVGIARGPGGRDVIEVVDGTGSCCAIERGAHFQLTLLGLTADGIKSIFEATLYDAWYQSPTPPSSEQIGTVSLEGDRLELTTEVRCSDYREEGEEPSPEGTEPLVPSDEPVEPAEPVEPSCTPSSVTTTWTFDGRRYVQQSAP